MTPPQAIEVEESILGALLLEGKSITKVIDILTERTFYKPAHRAIYAAILALFQRNEPVDLLTLTAELKSQGNLEKIGGEYYLTKLTTKVSSAANIEYHAHIILERALARDVIGLSSGAMTRAYDETEDVIELINDLSLGLTNIQSGVIKNRSISAPQIAKETNEEIEKIHTGQDESLKSGFIDIDAITGGYRKGNLIIVAGLEKSGKCFGRDVTVLMFDGTTKKVQDIMVGDIIMGDDSTPRTVLTTTMGNDELYNVSLSRNAGSFVCNREHLLVLRRNSYAKTIKQGKRRNGEIIEIPVCEYLKKCTGGFREHYRQFKLPVSFCAQYLPIDPYLLGLWLGDGHAAGSRITTADAPIINWLENYAKINGSKFLLRTTKSKACTISISETSQTRKRTLSMAYKLRELNLINNKHIPLNYQANSRENRLKLLAGLIDSDGYCGGNSTVCFCNKNKLLCEQTMFVARSLGFHCCNPKIKHNKKYNTDYYVIFISGNIQDIPILLKRKILPKSQKPKTVCQYTFKVTPLGRGDYYGFTVNGNGRFLLGDLTVSHNSTAVLQTMFYNAKKGVPCLFFSLEMTRVELMLRYALIEERLSWLKLVGRRLTTLEIERLKRKVDVLGKLPFYVLDRPVHIVDIMAESARMINEKGIRLIVADYTQKVVPITKKANESREREVANISGGLKNIAFEHKIVLIALSQLNDELRARESKAIEQDADKIITFDAPDKDEPTADGTGIIKGIRIRQRFGAGGNFGDCKMIYDKLFGYWKSYSGQDEMLEPVRQQELINDDPF
jgi:replicative DNA helicase